MDKKNRVALLVGASDGIGKATAKRLVRDGMKVVVFARRQEACEAVVNDLIKLTGDSSCAIYSVGDIISEEDLRSAVKAAVDTFGGLDVLVNIAAAQAAGTILDVGPEDYAHMFGVNVMGYGLAAKAAIPELLKSDSPSIVSIASLNGCIGIPNRTLYSCTKAAVIEMTECLACDFPTIRANCISPGFTATESMLAGLAMSGIDPQECAKLISARTIMQRMAEPREIADIVAFLASESASYITGQNIVADGGALCFGNFDYEMTKFLRAMEEKH